MSRRIEPSASSVEGNRLHNESLAENGKLLFTRWREVPGAFLVARDRLVAARLFPDASGELGAVYLGRVKDAAENLSAYFVEFREREVGFLKESRIPREILPLRQGDLIPVCVMALPQRGKRAGLSARIDWKHLPDGERIREQAQHRTAFSLLLPAPNPQISSLSDLVRAGEYAEIVTDDAKLYDMLERLRSASDGKSPEAIPRLETGDFSKPRNARGQGSALPDSCTIRLYTDAFPLAKLYKLESRMEEALSRHVWLKSGGDLIFDHTEAMTVVDVNTGKVPPHRIHNAGDPEEAFLRLNLEAAEELARQLRLRNISGMIVADFVNLEREEDRETLLSAMREFTAEDPCEVLVFDITKLGLLELTRKKKLPSLREQAKGIKG